jgi:hypothetical protein
MDTSGPTPSSSVTDCHCWQKGSTGIDRAFHVLIRTALKTHDGFLARPGQPFAHSYFCTAEGRILIIGLHATVSYIDMFYQFVHTLSHLPYRTYNTSLQLIMHEALHYRCYTKRVRPWKIRHRSRRTVPRLHSSAKTGFCALSFHQAYCSHRLR